MPQNQILLKGGDSSKVVDEAPDTRMVLMDGLVVKSHRLVLSSNAFLHQLLSSSWILGEISTFIMPQHTVTDLLQEFPFPGNILSGETGAFVKVITHTSEIEEEEQNKTHGTNNEINFDFGKIKVEESDYDGEHLLGNIDEFEQPIESGEISCANNVSPMFEETLNEMETPRKRLRLESSSIESPSGERRRRKRNEDDKQSSGSEFNAKDIPEDNLIVEVFGDNVNLAETVTTDDSDSSKTEFGIANEETDTEERLNKTLVSLSLKNVDVKAKSRRQARPRGVTAKQKNRKVDFDQPSRQAPVQSVDLQELTSLDFELKDKVCSHCFKKVGNLKRHMRESCRGITENLTDCQLCGAKILKNCLTEHIEGRKDLVKGKNTYVGCREKQSREGGDGKEKTICKVCGKLLRKEYANIHMKKFHQILVKSGSSLPKS